MVNRKGPKRAREELPLELELQRLAELELQRRLGESVALLVPETTNTPTVTVAAAPLGEPLRISSPDDAAAAFGKDSEMHAWARGFFARPRATAITIARTPAHREE